MKNRLALLSLLPGALLLCASAAAQVYPSKPIRLVVPNPAGGNDVYIRTMSPRLAELLGQQIVIENRPGASGAIGAENIARSAPDGYSLLFCTSAQIVISPFLNKSLPYDTVRDFTPISMLMQPVIAMTVNAALPVNSVRELIAYAKSHPGKLSYGSSGPGSVPHLDGELFKAGTATDMLHVPYKGIAQIVPELVAGRLDLAFPPLGSAAPYLASGKVKVLAVLDATRPARHPDIPSILDSLPGYRRAPLWFSLFGPANLPRSIVDRLQGAFVKAMEAPEVRANFDAAYLRVIGSTPEELASTIRADIALTADLAKSIGLKAE